MINRQCLVVAEAIGLVSMGEQIVARQIVEREEQQNDGKGTPPLKPVYDGSSDCHENTREKENTCSRRDAADGILHEGTEEYQHHQCEQLHGQGVEVVLPKHLEQELFVVVGYRSHQPGAQRFGEIGLHAPLVFVLFDVIDHGCLVTSRPNSALQRARPISRTIAENVLVGELEIQGNESQQGDEAAEKSKDVEQDFACRSQFVVAAKHKYVVDVKGEEAKGNEAVVEGKLGEWPCQAGKEGKPEAVQQIGGEVPAHDESAKTDAHEKKAPEIDLAKILGSEEQVADSKLATNAAVNLQGKKNPDAE